MIILSEMQCGYIIGKDKVHTHITTTGDGIYVRMIK